MPAPTAPADDEDPAILARGEVVPENPLWRAWSPWQVNELLAGVSVPWYVAGGWALDLWHGRETREHGDIEIAVPRADFGAIRDALGAYTFDVVGSGRRWPLSDHEADAAYFQTWLRDPESGVYHAEVFRDPHDGDVWIFRREARIRLPYAEIVAHDAHGVPYLSPHLALLFAAKSSALPKHEFDFVTALPALTVEQRAWLLDALRVVHPGHAWLGRLAAFEA
jgi:hypothetical protein